MAKAIMQKIFDVLA